MAKKNSNIERKLAKVIVVFNVATNLLMIFPSIGFTYAIVTGNIFGKESIIIIIGICCIFYSFYFSIKFNRFWNKLPYEVALAFRLWAMSVAHYLAFFIYLNWLLGFSIVSFSTDVLLFSSPVLIPLTLSLIGIYVNQLKEPYQQGQVSSSKLLNPKNPDNLSSQPTISPKRLPARPLQTMQYMESQNQSSIAKLSQWLKESIVVKLMAIGFIILILLIPDSMISDLIYERQSRQSEVEREVNQSWGGEQNIVGPLLSIPYSTWSELSDGKKVEQNHVAYFLPQALELEGRLGHQIRRRSIFDVVLYQSQFTLKGNFEKPDFNSLHINPEDVKWEAARISIGIKSMSGIKEVVEMGWNGETHRMKPGTANTILLPTGVSVEVQMELDAENFAFYIPVKLNGSGHFHIEPVGQSNTVKINSDWHSPSFDGAFLPDKREITQDGFNAEWQVLDLNRPYPQYWIDGGVNFGQSSFGVSLIQPVDEYAKNYRSAKYAILIIGLTFLLYFFFEVLQKLLIHPFQYLLVGLALTVFYLLLLSLSEHLGFNIAYIISAASTILLITGYSWSILNIKKLVFQMFLMLVGIYGFIFILLQLEDFALLAGSIGVFIALAAVMYSSRKVNWYDLGERGSK